jgi:hypothetical protein
LVVANSDGPAGPDENIGLPEAAPEAARSDLISVLPEVLADNVAREEASEALSRETGAADHAEPGDAPSTEAGTETPGLDVAAQDSSGDVPAGATYEVGSVVVDGSLASFCSGDSAHMIVNGIESRPAVSAHQLCYECCLAGDFIAVTATFSVPIQFAWLGLGTSSQTVDLSKAPKGWEFSLVAGCDSTISSFECPLGTNTCATPGEVYRSGFQGTLELERTSDNNVNTSLCLHFEAPAGATNPTIRRLDLYAPHVAWSK